MAASAENDALIAPLLARLQYVEAQLAALTAAPGATDTLEKRITDLTATLEDERAIRQRVQDQYVTAQQQRGVLYEQYLIVDNEHRLLLKTHQETLETLNRVLATRAWKLATGYWVARERLKRAISSPFRVGYQGLRRLYHALVPLSLRLRFRTLRRRVTLGTHDTARPHETGATLPITRPGSGHDQRAIFIFATVPYHDVGGGQRSAQLAKTFGKMAYNVYYLYAVSSVDGSDTHAIPVPTLLHVHVSGVAPGGLIPLLGASPIFIFEAPYPVFEPYLALAGQVGASIVYEHIDNWNTELGRRFFRQDVFERFIAAATLIIATNGTLVTYIQATVSQNPTLQGSLANLLYAPNAVDLDLFDPIYPHERPSDLVIGDPTLLYYGSLWGSWFNWQLLSDLAQALPGAAINLIGDYGLVQERLSAMPPNVHFLGLKPHKGLPAYLAHSTIAIIPFQKDDFSTGSSPLKVFEYIAMGKPIMANPLPEIAHYPGVQSSTDLADWVTFVEGGYKTRWNTAQRIQDQQAFALRNNWYARCNEIVTELGKRAQPPTISIIVLNHNNRKVIFKCVNSLLEFSARYDYEVIVVDNQSTDGSYELLQQNDRIALYRNTVNGCSSGRNLGVQHAHGDLLVFLDSDQWVVSENWLDVALDILDKQRHIGAVSRNAGWFTPGKVVGPISLALPDEGMAPGQLYRTDIAFLATSGLIMRRALFDSLGGFDPIYDPTCYEDTDLTLSVRDAGFEIAYTTHLAINHLPHQTTEMGSARHTALMERNGAHFRQKWLAKNPALLTYYLPE